MSDDGENKTEKKFGFNPKGRFSNIKPAFIKKRFFKSDDSNEGESSRDKPRSAFGRNNFDNKRNVGGANRFGPSNRSSSFDSRNRFSSNVGRNFNKDENRSGDRDDKFKDNSSDRPSYARNSERKYEGSSRPSYGRSFDKKQDSSGRPSYSRGDSNGGYKGNSTRQSYGRDFDRASEKSDRPYDLKSPGRVAEKSETSGYRGNDNNRGYQGNRDKPSYRRNFSDSSKPSSFGRSNNFPRESSREFDKNRKERIAKHLSTLGISSRRDAEKLVTEGKVKINSIECKELSFLVDYDDEIMINGKKIENKFKPIKILLMNKPKGYLTTTSDPQGRKTIFDLIPEKFGKLISVGRLDYNSEGLILLTNNGEAARILELPLTGLKRVYKVRVFGQVDIEKLTELRRGIVIGGIQYGKFNVVPIKIGTNNSWLKVIVYEGKNREVRNVLGHFGLTVTRLIRTHYGSYDVFDVPEGCIIESKYKFDIAFYLRLQEKNKKFFEMIAKKNGEAYEMNKDDEHDKLLESEIDNNDNDTFEAIDENDADDLDIDDDSDNEENDNRNA